MSLVPSNLRPKEPLPRVRHEQGEKRPPLLPEQSARTPEQSTRDQGEQRFRNLVESLDAVVWEADARSGRITFMSKRAERLFGYPVEKWTGDPAFWMEQVYPDDRDWVIASRRTAVRSGRGYQLEYRVLSAEGRTVWLWEKVGVARDGNDRVEGLRGLTIDITQRKLIENRREAEHEAVRALKERERQAALLATATAMLGASLRYEETLEQVAQLAVPAMADWCVVHVIEPGGLLRLVTLTHADPARADLADELRARSSDRIDLTTTRGVSKVVRTGAPEMAANIEDDWLLDIARGDPAFHDLLRRIGPVSYVCVPLTARGRVLGAITFATAESGRSYGPADFGLAQELAQRTAFAVDNARLYQERSHIARTLQNSLLPPSLPEIPGVELVARYHAAGEGYEVGGDFYDVFYTGRRNWAVVIGDVCGKGPEAAALTALTRYTVRTAAMQSRKPRYVLSVLNQAILGHGQESSFCTAIYARAEIQPDGMRVVVGRGGHPPALLLRSSGELEVIDPPGSLLGVMPDLSLNDQTVHMRAGDALILYTDGVTEARGPAGVFGDAALRALVASCAGMPAKAIADRIERTVLDFQNGQPHDDIALLVLRVAPDRA